ncbi:GNAT family N-acetyltransferase, partial [Streptomyces chartreusis]|uniref:GNAT family N-acetyltransferase n=1 Tax=Streptomyces chartreusis TaxID=1969 RepID=UPI0033EB5F48
APRPVPKLYSCVSACRGSPAVSWCNWVLRLRAGACLVGTVQATITADGIAEIAWVIGTPWQRRGLASEAARGLVAWLEQGPVHTVVAHVHPAHHASATVAAAAGLAPTQEWQDGEVRWRRQRLPR